MASTIYTYDLTGGTKFPVSFEYLARRFVRITLIGASRLELTLNVDYRFTSKMEIETTIPWVPSEEYSTLEVRRVTSATDRLVNFTDGSILRSQDLNISQIQAIHIAEEGRDVAENSLAANGFQWNALGYPIRNLGYPSLPTDAANVQYVTDKLSYTLRAGQTEVLREIPTDRANKVLGFDANRQPVALIPSAGSSIELELELGDNTKGARKIAIKMQDGKEGNLNDVLTSTGPFAPASLFPRVLKYSNGPVPTSAFNVVAGATPYDKATDRLRKALADGADILIEQSMDVLYVEATLQTQRAGQTITGLGINSRIGQHTAGINLILMQHDNSLVEFVHVYPSNVRTSTFAGYGIYSYGNKDSTVTRIFVTGGRSGGIGMANVTANSVISTRHFKSAVDPDVDMVNATGHDVVLQRSCSDCLIEDVRSVSGIGTTVSIQPGTTEASSSLDNVIKDVWVKDQCVYGIMVYTHDQLIQQILRTQIINPQIHGVSGKPLSNITNNRPFGAGVFIQGSEFTDVYGGSISRTNTFTDNETLAPGGVGVLNTRGFRIKDTRIFDTTYHGIHVSCLPTMGDPKGIGRIEGVHVQDSGKAGLNIAHHNKLIVDDSTFVRSGGNGILSRNTVTDAVELFVSNSLITDNNESGISTTEVINKLVVSNTIIDRNRVHGISSRARTTEIKGGTCSSNILNDGIDITADVVKGSVSGTEVSRNGRYGVRNQSVGFRVEQSAVVELNTTADFAGLLGNDKTRTLADIATPSVNGGDDYKTGGTTAITTFTNGTKGQEISVYVQHTITIMGEALTSGAVRKYKNIGGAFRKLT